MCRLMKFQEKRSRQFQGLSQLFLPFLLIITYGTFCSSWSTRLLLYFLLFLRSSVRPSERHRRDITHLDQTSHTFSKSLSLWLSVAKISPMHHIIISFPSHLDFLLNFLRHPRRPRHPLPRRHRHTRRHIIIFRNPIVYLV